MTTPKNYKLVYPMFIGSLQLLEKQAIKNNQVNDIYFHLKKFLYIAFEKCNNNEEYCNKWLLWFSGRKSTLLLRDLFLEVKCNYWENLINGNAIDTLDSLQCKITESITPFPTY